MCYNETSSDCISTDQWLPNYCNGTELDFTERSQAAKCPWMQRVLKILDMFFTIFLATMIICKNVSILKTDDISASR